MLRPPPLRPEGGERVEGPRTPSPSPYETMESDGYFSPWQSLALCAIRQNLIFGGEKSDFSGEKLLILR